VLSWNRNIQEIIHSPLSFYALDRSLFRCPASARANFGLWPKDEFPALFFYATKLVVLSYDKLATVRSVVHIILDFILRAGVPLLDRANWTTRPLRTCWETWEQSILEPGISIFCSNRSRPLKGLAWQFAFGRCCDCSKCIGGLKSTRL